MTFSVTMPALGESVTEGTVTRWLKNEGDHVNVDEPLLEVSTDKVDTEIPSPVSGTLTRIIVAVDSTVAVGAELAVIEEQATSANVAPSVPAPIAAPVVEVPAPVTSVMAEAPVAPAAVVTPPAPVAPQAPTNEAAGVIVTMPALGESVTEGTVTRWLKSVGESINVDEPLLEVSTDKVDTEIPSPATGTILAIDVPVDATVAVGARLALIGAAGAPVVVAPPTPPTPPAPPAPPAPPTPPTPPAPVFAAPGPLAAPVVATVTSEALAPAPAVSAPLAPTPVAAVSQIDSSYVTPIVRQFAKEQGVELASVTGSGVGGRIRKEDIVAAAKPAPVATANPVSTAAAAKSVAPAAVSPLRGTTVKMSRLRKVIAARMVESLQISAQLTTVVEVDLTKIARLRDKAKASFATREGVNLTYLPFFAVAVCEALKQHPVLNSSLEGDEVTYHGAEHLGIAVDTDRGLLVPVIRDAGDLNIAGLSRKISDVAARTRDSKIAPDELGGGTFTITNTGSRGALFDTPIINQPQVAILGIGAVVKRPIVLKGADGGENIAIRSMVYLALSYDHRIVDGADAARFLVTLKERLEEGSFESDLGL